MFVPSALVGVRGHIWGARYVVRQLQTAELLSEGVADMHLPDGSAFMAAHNTWVCHFAPAHRRDWDDSIYALALLQIGARVTTGTRFAVHAILVAVSSPDKHSSYNPF